MLTYDLAVLYLLINQQKSKFADDCALFRGRLVGCQFFADVDAANVFEGGVVSVDNFTLAFVDIGLFLPWRCELEEYLCFALDASLSGGEGVPLSVLGPLGGHLFLPLAVDIPAQYFILVHEPSFLQLLNNPIFFPDHRLQLLHNGSQFGIFLPEQSDDLIGLLQGLYLKGILGH